MIKLRYMFLARGWCAVSEDTIYYTTLHTSPFKLRRLLNEYKKKIVRLPESLMLALKKPTAMRTEHDIHLIVDDGDMLIACRRGPQVCATPLTDIDSKLAKRIVRRAYDLSDVKLVNLAEFSTVYNKRYWI